MGRWVGCCTSTCCFCCSTAAAVVCCISQCLNRHAEGPVTAGHRKSKICSNDLCMNVLTYYCCTCYCGAIHGRWVGGSESRVLLYVQLLLYVVLQHMVHAGAWLCQVAIPPFFLTVTGVVAALWITGRNNCYGLFSFLPVYRPR